MLGQQGVLRVVPGPVLERSLQKQAAEKAAAALPVSSEEPLTGLAAHIRTRYQIFSQHRDSQAGWNSRLLRALRAFNGQYEPEKLQAIRQFGGSDVYARLIAMKCRGATALLRDVYLGADRPWGLEPAEDPDIPPHIAQSIASLVQAETATIAAAGQEVTPEVIRDRTMELMMEARASAKKLARKQAAISEDKIDEILGEGGYYKGIGEFLVDLPLFPFACIKGPVVRIAPKVIWQGAKPVVQQIPKLFWYRVSPFDICWTPGVSDIEDAEMIERVRYTRADLNDLLDLPGYNHEALRAVLEEYGRGGLNDNYDSTDSERAVQENRENPNTNQSGIISALEYHGNVQGLALLQAGMNPEMIADPLRDYAVQAWLIGRHIIKVQFSPSPRKRHPYYITSFEKVPGTPVGNGLPDLLSDIADVCNATLRSLVNNLSISSGPQVVVNTDRLASDEDGEEMYPWKRWRTITDPLASNTQVPISFFQPTSNAAELLNVYKEFSAIADELSAIPKYLSGGSAGGGAGRTAAGLAMLMGNASKILQTVAANVDRDIFEPSLTSLFDMLMLTDTSGLLTGQEQVRVMGVTVAVQRETQRARQIEFLTATANPIDAKIIGPKGRAVVLSAVADGIGIPGDQIVPDEDEIEQLVQQEQILQQQEMLGAGAAGAQAQGGQRGKTSTNDMGPRVRIAGGVG